MASHGAATVFLHGAGRSGAAAWPMQSSIARGGSVMLERHPDGDDPVRDSVRIVEGAERAGGAHVAAWSYGGNAAIIAAQLRPDLVNSLVLIEPIAADLARGRPAVEEHIAAMNPVFVAARNPRVTTREFSRMYAEGKGTPVPDMPDDELERAVAALRALPVPWNTAIDPALGLTVPTLVVTGGWSDLYEQIAASLTDLGARHERIEGYGHRPHFAPEANAIIGAFWATVEQRLAPFTRAQ